jgi:nucleoside-diphosphate-sugar epimerase
MGRRAVRRLKSRGFTVRSLVHRNAVVEADEQLPGSLDDFRTLDQAVRGVDVVVHLAAATHARDPRTYEIVNTRGTANLVRAAERAGVQRFVHASTRAISVKGGAYSVSKLHAEAIVRRSAVEHTILRLAEVYGGGGQVGIDRIVDAARRGASVLIVGDGSDRICPIHVDDAVAAVSAAVDAPTAAGKEYTIGGGCLTVLDFVAACQGAFGSDSRLIRVPTRVVGVAAWAARLLPLPLYPDQLQRLQSPKDDPSPEAASDLGFEPRPLSEGLAMLREIRNQYPS